MKGNKTLSGNFAQDRETLKELLRAGVSFDIMARPLEIAGKESMLFFVNGFVQSEVMEKVVAFLIRLPSGRADAGTAKEFIARNVSLMETGESDDLNTIVTDILSGKLCLISECFSGAVMIEARSYPARGVQEPDDDRALRGARDSFVETIVCNTALIRRRIRDPSLTMEALKVGNSSRTDVILCYMDGRADKSYVDKLRKQIYSLSVLFS